MEYIRITQNTMKWFTPILPEEYRYFDKLEQGTFLIGAVCGQTACGVLVFQFFDPVIDIVYLAVSTEYQRRGIATGMVRFLCDCAWEDAIPVFCSFSAKGEGEAIKEFFESLDDFTITKEDEECYRITKEALAGAKLPKLRYDSGKIAEFYSLPKPLQNSFIKTIKEQNFEYFSINSDSFYVKKELCLCYVKNESIEAAIFVEQREDGDFELSFAYSASQNTDILILFEEAGKRALEQMSAENSLHITAINESSRKFIQKLLPEAELESELYCAVWDMEPHRIQKASEI